MSYFLHVTNIGSQQIAIGISAQKDGRIRVNRHLRGDDIPPSEIGRTLHYHLTTDDRRVAQRVLAEVRSSLERGGAIRIGRTDPRHDMLFEVDNIRSATFRIQSVLRKSEFYSPASKSTKA